MDPVSIGQSYDQIAERWSSPEHPLSGLTAHERALRFVKHRGHALDVGCGCNGRFLDMLRTSGFQFEGVDVSRRMIALARERDPDVVFHHADIREWTPPRAYDFITAWDSVWHVPLESQPGVLEKLMNALAPGGVLVFTMGGLDEPGEVRNAHMGVPMYHATMGIPATATLITRSGCSLRHLEFDQPPEQHLVVIAQR